MTWGELINMIMDITKQISDDSIFNEDHIKFLCGKYRNYLLNQQYLSGRKKINDANYQTICIELQRDSLDICSYEDGLKSIEQIPFTMTIGSKSIYPSGIFNIRNKFSYVPVDRFPYIENKYNKKSVFVTIGPDNHLYLKSSDSNMLFLSNVSIRAIFEDIEQASMLEEKCRTNCDSCDLFDVRFPLEDAWINMLINLVVNDLVRGINNLRDNKNDATDDSDQLARQIQIYTNNAFKALTKGNNYDDQQQ